MGCNSSSPAKEPQDKAGAQLRSFVIWGAKGLPAGDSFTGSDSYCIARVGPTGSSWKDLPRSAGRRSAPLQGTRDPEWNMGFTLDLRGISNPEVQIRVFDKDFISEDDFLGETRISLADLGDQERKELELKREGKSSGTLTLGSGSTGFLEKVNVKPSAFYETLAKMGQQKSVKVEDITADGPLRIGGNSLPRVLQGIFWLSDQKSSSALASFGGPSNDGGGVCLGRLTGKRCEIRVGGDRVWSLAEQNFINGEALQTADLVYHFVFNDAENPTKCQIYPETRTLGITFTAEWLLDFEMELDPANKEYPGSVVWKRLSYALGESVKPYALVQVMDGSGKRVEPAWSEFVKYQKTKVTGSSPGTIWYREIP